MVTISSIISKVITEGIVMVDEPPLNLQDVSGLAGISDIVDLN